MQDFTSFSDFARVSKDAESALQQSRAERELVLVDQIQTAEITEGIANRSGADGSVGMLAEVHQQQKQLELRITAAQEQAQEGIAELRAEQLERHVELAMFAQEASDKAAANAENLERADFRRVQSDVAGEEVAAHRAIAENFDKCAVELAKFIAEDELAHHRLDSPATAATEALAEANVKWVTHLDQARLLTLAAASVFDPERRGRMFYGGLPASYRDAPRNSFFYQPGGRVVVGYAGQDLSVARASAEVDGFGRVWQVAGDGANAENRQCIGRVARNSGAIYFNAPNTGMERQGGQFSAELGEIRIAGGAAESVRIGALWERLDRESNGQTDASVRNSGIELPDRPVELAIVPGRDDTERRIVLMPVSRLQYDDNPIAGGWGPGKVSVKGPTYEEMCAAMHGFQERVLPQMLAGKSVPELLESTGHLPSGLVDWSSDAQLVSHFVSGGDPVTVGRDANGGLSVDFGRHRIQIARDLGYTHVPVHLRDD